MPFTFKQFAIKQEKTAMKVGTDGVLLGAWANCTGAKKILDIGSGTGLISLMLAQRNVDAKIQAIEIEGDAFEESQENVNNSPWRNRISIINSSFQDFVKQSSDTYDSIVSNPPFFSNSQLTEIKKRNLARHTNSLDFGTLIQLVSKILMPNGLFSIIIPINEENNITKIALINQLFLTRKTTIKPNVKRPPKRVLLEFSRVHHSIIEDELIIEIDRHVYTKEYINLTKDFYLKM